MPMNDFDPSGDNYSWFDAGWDAGHRPGYASFGGQNPWTNDREPLFLSGRWGTDPSGTINARGYHAGTSPVDAYMNVWQQWGAPIASYMLAAKVMRPIRDNLYRPRMKGPQAQLWRTFGVASPRWGMASQVGYSLGRFAGGLGGEAIGGFMGAVGGVGSAAGGARIGAAVMGGLGGAAGGLFSAFMGPEAVLGYGIVQGASSGIFDPYINRRRMAESMLTSYAGTAISGDRSAKYGTGMSAVAAHRIAAAFQGESWRDLSMSNNTRAQIAGLSAGNDLIPGMAGGVSADALTKRLNSIVESSKQTMRVLKISEDRLREVNAIIKQFSDSGVSPGAGMNRLMGSLGTASKATGWSGMDILNTEMPRFGGVASSMGLGVEAGMQVGSLALAGVAGLRQRGMVSEPWLGLYGGQSGMASSFVQAGAIGVSTPYASLQQYNRFIGGVDARGMGATLGAFSRAVGRDPLSAVGAMASQGRMMRTADLADNRFGWLSQYTEMARLMGRSKIGADELSAMLSTSMGDAEINATLAQIREVQSGATLPAMQKELDERQRARMSATGETGWGFEYGIKRRWSEAMYSADRALQDNANLSNLGMGIGALLATPRAGRAVGRISGGLAVRAAAPLARRAGMAAGTTFGEMVAKRAALGMAGRVAVGAGAVAAGILSAPVATAVGLAYAGYELYHAAPAISDFVSNKFYEFSYGTSADRGLSGATKESISKDLQGIAKDLDIRDVGNLETAFELTRELLAGGDPDTAFSTIHRKLKGKSKNEQYETIKAMANMGVFGNGGRTERDIRNIMAAMDKGASPAHRANTAKWLSQNALSDPAKMQLGDLAKGKTGGYMLAADPRNPELLRLHNRGHYSKMKDPETQYNAMLDEMQASQRRNNELISLQGIEQLKTAMESGAGKTEVEALSVRAFGESVQQFGEYVRQLPGAGNAGNSAFNNLGAG